MKILFGLLLIPALSFAGNSGERQISRVEVTEDFFTVYAASPFEKETCDVGSPIAFKREDFPEGYKSMLSTALAAHMANKKITMWFNGCQESPWSGTMPKPTSIVIQ